MDKRKLAISVFFMVLALIAVYCIATMPNRSYFFTALLLCLFMSFAFFRQARNGKR
ncbi:MAG: hypothetical protein IJC14_01015 [Firmicutes bacterium]|nr:hypothetical protein [Bacillota bacterium]